MKQVFQDLRSGVTLVEDVPVPTPPPGHLLIRTQASLISAGTERMLVDFGRGSYVSKARQQPDKVREVLDKIRTDGLAATVQAVQHKLNEPMPMGYANAGEVVQVGDGVSDFEPGDRVASNGPHAEWVTVPTTLAAKLPSEGDVSPEEVAFASVGAIALQSVRLAEPTLGERFVVTGLGLVGLLAVQFLHASGCKVLGVDLDEERLELAASFGAETVNLRNSDPLSAAAAFSGGRGVDGVIVAAATTSNEPIHQAATMSRKRGRIVLVGVAGLELQRADFYEKELSFQVSSSYGPGRYDPDYEDRAADYPFGFVRWTAARNQQAVLELLATGALDVKSLISHRFDLDDAPDAYELLSSADPSLGIVLRYPERAPTRDPQTVSIRPVTASQAAADSRLKVGFIGAGNYTRKVLLPAIDRTSVDLAVVASRTGTSAALAAKQFDFGRATTRTEDVLDGDDVDVVFITTRHDSHAELVDRALRAGKHVFVEKPLAIHRDELDTIEQTLTELGDQAPLLMVGFNRRFSPQVEAIVAAVRDHAPVAVQMTVNAGPVPADSWLHDPNVGGGRIIGEACHFIDLARHIAQAPVSGISPHRLGVNGPTDSVVVGLSFDDGSVASINYLSTGHRKIPKERIEVFHRGRVAQLDNFRRLHAHGFGPLSPKRLLRQDKGHASCVAAFLDAVRRGQPAPIAPQELIEVSRTAFDAADGVANPREPLAE